MYNNNKKINYKEQEVFKNERSFNRAMRQLVRVRVVSEKQDGNFYPVFKLLFNGSFLIRINLIPLEVRQ